MSQAPKRAWDGHQRQPGELQEHPDHRYQLGPAQAHQEGPSTPVAGIGHGAQDHQHQEGPAQGRRRRPVRVAGQLGNGRKNQKLTKL